ncbi:hypothetical protein HZA87_02770 [Candidatus Uhrbacteria bacterium]|nr:hypothetical protein [Candidatus Uhrbacteria bacterium]
MSELLSAIARCPLRNAIAVGNAEWLSLIHSRELKIAANERRKYFRKAMHFALYFGGFSHTGSTPEMMGAGRAAFLACSYDVVTDWRGFDRHYLEIFERQLKQCATQDLENMALELYGKDKMNIFTHDGLERGSIAFRFVTEMMGVRGKIEDTGLDIDETGRILQIVDDVLDYEEDIEAGETNCLATPGRQDHLGALISTDIQTHFLPQTPLTVVIEIARIKAQKMLP